MRFGKVRGFCKTSAFQQKYYHRAPLVHLLELAGRFCKRLVLYSDNLMAFVKMKPEAFAKHQIFVEVLL